MRALLPVVFGTALAIASTGCIKSMLTNGQISSTRQASGALDTVGDYEMARQAVGAGLAQFEGMHQLAPDNEDALFLLTKSWGAWGFAFVEDDYDTADLQNDDDTAAYHKKRAKMAYDRAVFYGLELLSHTAGGFDEARKNEDKIKKWLDDNFTDKDLAGNLFWTGYAWLSRVNIDKEDPALVGELYVGVALLEQAFELDPSYNHYSAEVALAAYHARNAMAEMDQAQKMFEDALQKTERKNLMVPLTYATKFYCVKGDKANYEKLVNEVLSSEDPDPKLRFNNTLAKRRAKRALAKERMDDCGF